MEQREPDKFSISINRKTMECTIGFSLLHERLSLNGKTTILSTTGNKFTPIEGTNLLFKLVVIKDQKSDRIFPDEQSGKSKSNSSKGKEETHG